MKEETRRLICYFGRGMGAYSKKYGIYNVTAKAKNFWAFFQVKNVNDYELV